MNSAFDVAGRVWASREDLQVSYPQDGERWPFDFWFWVETCGRSEYPELQRELAALPPHYLIGRVFGEGCSTGDFLRSGLANAAIFERLFRRHGVEVCGDGLGVLDFGVGCGRIARFFGPRAGRRAFFGTDVDEDAVRWCRQALRFGSFCQLSRDAVELPYPDATFDCIYSYSVFSHLPANRAESLISELSRVLSPGGKAIVTVHGEYAIRAIVDGQREHPHPMPEALSREVGAIASAGFGFFPYEQLCPVDGRNKEFFSRWDLSEYGTAFVLDAERCWGHLVDVLAVHESEDGWQDHVVFRRKQ